MPRGFALSVGGGGWNSRGSEGADNPSYFSSTLLPHETGRHLLCCTVGAQTKAFDVGVSGGPVLPGAASLDFTDCNHWSGSRWGWSEGVGVSSGGVLSGEWWGWRGGG